MKKSGFNKSTAHPLPAKVSVTTADLQKQLRRSYVCGVVLGIFLAASCALLGWAIAVVASQHTHSTRPAVPHAASVVPLGNDTPDDTQQDRLAAHRASRSQVRKVLTAQVSTPGQIWNRLATCESTSNWHINTGNGFFGGLQFKQGTWTSFGGLRYSARADLASKTQQITVATRVLKVQGWGAWPVCSRKIGAR